MKKIQFFFTCLSLLVAGFAACSNGDKDVQQTAGVPSVSVTLEAATDASLTFVVKTTDADNVWGLLVRNTAAGVTATKVKESGEKLSGTAAGLQVVCPELDYETTYTYCVVAANAQGESAVTTCQGITAPVNGEVMVLTEGALSPVNGEAGFYVLSLSSDTATARFKLHVKDGDRYPAGEFPVAASGTGNCIVPDASESFIGVFNAAGAATQYMLAVGTAEEPSTLTLATENGYDYTVSFSIHCDSKLPPSYAQPVETDDRFVAAATKLHLRDPKAPEAFSVANRFAGADRVTADGDAANLCHLVFESAPDSGEAMELFLYGGTMSRAAASTTYTVGEGTEDGTLGVQSFVHFGGVTYLFSEGAVTVAVAEEGYTFTFNNVLAVCDEDSAKISGQATLPVGNMSAAEKVETLAFDAADAKLVYKNNAPGWLLALTDSATKNALTLLLAADPTEYPAERTFYAAAEGSATQPMFLHVGEIDGAPASFLSLGGSNETTFAAGRDSYVTLTRKEGDTFEVAFSLLSGSTAYTGAVTVAAEPVRTFDATTAALRGARMLNGDTRKNYPADVLPVSISGLGDTELVLAFEVGASREDALIDNNKTVVFKPGTGIGTLNTEYSVYKQNGVELPLTEGSVVVTRSGDTYTFEYHALGGLLAGTESVGALVGTWSGIVTLEQLPTEIYTPENITGARIDGMEGLKEVGTEMEVSHKMTLYFHDKERSEQPDGKRFYAQLAMIWDGDPLTGTWKFGGTASEVNRFSINLPKLTNDSSGTVLKDYNDYSSVTNWSLDGGTSKYYYSNRSSVTFSSEDNVIYTIDIDLLLTSDGTVVRELKGTYVGPIEGAFRGVYYDDKVMSVRARKDVLQNAAANYYGITLNIKNTKYMYRFRMYSGDELVADGQTKVFTVGSGTEDGTLFVNAEDAEAGSCYLFTPDVEAPEANGIPFTEGTLTISRSGDQYTIESNLYYVDPNTLKPARLLGTCTGPLLNRFPNLGDIDY